MNIRSTLGWYNFLNNFYSVKRNSSYYGQSTVQHNTLPGKNFARFEIARKLAEKILAADHTNNSSLFELTRTYNVWWIKL